MVDPLGIITTFEQKYMAMTDNQFALPLTPKQIVNRRWWPIGDKHISRLWFGVRIWSLLLFFLLLLESFQFKMIAIVVFTVPQWN